MFPTKRISPICYWRQSNGKLCNVSGNIIKHFFPFIAGTNQTIKSLIVSKTIILLIVSSVSKLYIALLYSLTPYMDFKQTFTDTNKLQTNIQHRNLPVNVPQLYELWHIYQDMTDKRKTLEKRRIEIANQLRRSSDGSNENLIRKYKTEGIIVREDLKILKDKLYCLEEKFIGEFLRLPNDLHARTPHDHSVILQEYGELLSSVGTDDSVTSHLSYTNEIDYVNGNYFYLKNDAAKFDLLTPYFTIDHFTNNGFIQCTTPDFIRTIVVEAAGLKPADVILVKEDDAKLNLLHLAGNGSMLSYLGYIAKLSLFKSALPLRFISTGKQYFYADDSAIGNNGLYSVGQSTAVQVFLATVEQDAQQTFDDTLSSITMLYKSFGKHFRTVYATSSDLMPSECLRVDIQMFSKHLNRYVTVGNLSLYNDYISKRLLFNYRDGKQLRFPYIIAGTVVNVTKLIAIQLENNQKIDLSFL